MKPIVNNLFKNLPENSPEELFQTLFSNDQIKIERIISKGQSSPVNEWYDQIQDEWILLLEGQAKIQFKEDLSHICLKPGDSLLIPAHCKHRVHWTDAENTTIWLAIHIYPSEKTRSHA